MTAPSLAQQRTALDADLIPADDPRQLGLGAVSPYQWLRAKPGRRLALDQVHVDDAQQEAARDGWRIWVSYSGGYIEAICELELRRRQRFARLRQQGPRPPIKCGPR